MEHRSETILTVAVVTYNHGHTVKQCIASIAQQTYRKIDLVIVDDYSCDFDEKEIDRFIRSLDDTSICSFTVDAFSEHQGIVAAHNRALQLARGEYILFMGGDDCLAEEDILEQVMDELDSRSAVDIFQGLAALDHGEQIPSPACMAHAQTGNLIDLFTETKRQSISQLLCIQSALFRTEWLRGIGGFPEHYEYTVDWPVYTQALCCNAVFSYSDLVITSMRDGGVFRTYDFSKLSFQKGYLHEAADAIRQYAIQHQQFVRPKNELVQLEYIAKLFECKVVSNFDWQLYSLPKRIKWKIKNRKRFQVNRMQIPHLRARIKTRMRRLFLDLIEIFVLIALLAKLADNGLTSFLNCLLPSCVAIFAFDIVHKTRTDFADFTNYAKILWVLVAILLLLIGLV